MIVPKSISDETLSKCFNFRSHGRIPTLTWKHPLHRATLSRSSQPLVGILGTFGRKSSADEALLEAISRTNPNKKFYIIDPRPKANAIGNTAKGGRKKYKWIFLL